MEGGGGVNGLALICGTLQRCTVQSNVISITRRWVGVNFQKANLYLTLELPLSVSYGSHILMSNFNCSTLNL